MSVTYNSLTNSLPVGQTCPSSQISHHVPARAGMTELVRPLVGQLDLERSSNLFSPRAARRCSKLHVKCTTPDPRLGIRLLYARGTQQVQHPLEPYYHNLAFAQHHLHNYTMPMHRIYTAEGVYTPTDKQALSKAITSLYTRALPAFYVVVLFIDLPKNSFFIGGETNDKFVRFNVQHLARHFEDKAKKLEFMRTYEEVVKPFTAGKGLDWEVCGFFSCP